MVSEKPYDSTTHQNVWYEHTNEHEAIIGPEGLPLTCQYIWFKSGKDRDNLVEWVFQYYRQRGFPYLKFSEDELRRDFNNLVKKEVKPDKILKNSDHVGNRIIKHYSQDLIVRTRFDKAPSLYDVFNDDEKFKKVLKNRMGYCMSIEDGVEVPYLFAISDRMILQGLQTSGIGSKLSMFKPINAKWLYAQYDCKNILDYSAGWGSRLLGALSLNKVYYGIDPLTYERCEKVRKFFNGKGYIIKGCSEDKNIYQQIPRIDLAFSSPPYYNLEKYSDDEDQCYNKFPDYNRWLKYYWEETIKNCFEVIRKNGIFVFNINDIHFISMHRIILKYFKFEKRIPIYTSYNHFNKKQNKGNQRCKDNIYVYRKII